MMKLSATTKSVWRLRRRRRRHQNRNLILSSDPIPHHHHHRRRFRPLCTLCTHATHKVIWFLRLLCRWCWHSVSWFFVARRQRLDKDDDLHIIDTCLTPSISNHTIVFFIRHTHCNRLRCDNDGGLISDGGVKFHCLWVTSLPNYSYIKKGEKLKRRADNFLLFIRPIINSFLFLRWMPRRWVLFTLFNDVRNERESEREREAHSPCYYYIPALIGASTWLILRTRDTILLTSIWRLVNTLWTCSFPCERAPAETKAMTYSFKSIPLKIVCNFVQYSSAQLITCHVCLVSVGVCCMF